MKVTKQESQKKAARPVIQDDGWETLNYDEYRYDHVLPDLCLRDPVLIQQCRPSDQRNITLLDIFLTFVNPKLVCNIVNAAQRTNINTWLVDGGRKKVLPSLRNLYLMYAVKVRVFGLQNKPIESVKNSRPQRENIEAYRYFDENFELADDMEHLKISKMEKLFTVIKISAEHLDELSSYFQSVIKEPGESAAGDEKLFHTTGNSGNIVQCQSKPDRIGLWFYQLCIRFKVGLPFVLWFRLKLGRQWVSMQV